MVWRPTWSPEKVKHLRANWRQNDKQTAREIGATANAVYKKRLRLGLAKNRKRA